MIEHPRIAIYNKEVTRLIMDVDEIEYSTLRGGEPHVSFSVKAVNLLQGEKHLTIDCRPCAFTDLGYLKMVVNTIRCAAPFDIRIDLLMPYFPGSTLNQDPTASVMAKFVTLMNFGLITIYDPQSNTVVDDLLINLNSVRVKNPDLPQWPSRKYVAVVVPDDETGIRRAQVVTSKLGYPVELIRCEERRDHCSAIFHQDRLFPSTPEGTYLMLSNAGNEHLDWMAEAVNRTYKDQWGRSADIDLYVTHGIFPDGTKKLHEHFTTLYSTTSWRSADDLRELDVIPVPIHALENRS